MRRTLSILSLLSAVLSAQLQFTRIACLPTGILVDGRPVCYDTDHNGVKEIIYATGNGTPQDQLRWQIWEYRPLNRFELVYADTGCYYPHRPGITSGNFRPYDAGDIDRDGLTDLFGQNEFWTETGDTFYNLLVSLESSTGTSYPKSLSWLFIYGIHALSANPLHLRDNLDGDTNREMACGATSSEIAFGVWENAGDNQNELVWHSFAVPGYTAFGDFDDDGAQEFAAAGGRTVLVLKSTGDNQYEPVYADTTDRNNGYDVFSGDVTGDGRPEFLVAFWTAPSYTFTLYMWQATGVNQYRRVLVDTKVYWTSESVLRASKCDDIDGDGVAEIIWATPKYLYVYKMTGPDQFQQVWQWEQDNGGDGIFTAVSDINNDGYNEIIASGGCSDSRTSIFEIEAVRVLQPNGGEAYVPGEDHYIKWLTFSPPRCDSLSVWFTPDNGRTLDLLAHGLPSATDSTLWHVPDLTSDSCKIRVIAYGPGAQIDESDSVFSITSTGQSDNAGPPVYETKLIGAFPNPLALSTTIAFQIGVGGQSSGNQGQSTTGRSRISLRICDVSGRSVATLANGVLKPGVYHRDWEVAPTVPNGIYFLDFTAGTYKATRKLVIAR